MSQTCNVCQGSGFVNTNQLEGMVPGWEALDHAELLAAILALTEPHDVAPCSCCGSGDPDEGYPWYGEPGEHYGDNDPAGKDGPYAYNGGLCECH